MQWIWWAVLFGSAALLLMILFRWKIRWRWFVYAALNICFAALALYLINISGILEHVHIPINPATLLMVGILGVPGLVLLVAMEFTLF